MVNIHQIIRDKAEEIRMLIQIHDELVFECRKDRAREWSEVVRAQMESAMRLKVPLKVDLGIGGNWVEMLTCRRVLTLNQNRSRKGH